MADTIWCAGRMGIVEEREMTNREYELSMMSDEELAWWLCDSGKIDCPNCPGRGHDDCESILIAWLRGEHKEDSNE